MPGRCISVPFMKFRLLIWVIFASCQPESNKPVAGADFLDTLSNIQVYSGDSINVSLAEEQLEKWNLRSVDSLFYQTYLATDKNFCGFQRNDSRVGGADCRQYYYGRIKPRKGGLQQVLVLQRYYLNDYENTLLLMTFDANDSLQSVLPVASLVFQAEIEPIFTSTIYPDKVVKQEVTKMKIPEEVDTVQHRLLYCTDSVTKTYTLVRGKYELTKKDSARYCVWKNDPD